jgi:hypothetical protein
VGGGLPHPDLTRPALTAWKGKTLKYAGLLVMPAGFFLAIAALVLFTEPMERSVFVVCGLAVEALGLGVAVRGHMLARGESRP